MKTFISLLLYKTGYNMARFAVRMNGQSWELFLDYWYEREKIRRGNSPVYDLDTCPTCHDKFNIQSDCKVCQNRKYKQLEAANSLLRDLLEESNRIVNGTFKPSMKKYHKAKMDHIQRHLDATE